MRVRVRVRVRVRGRGRVQIAAFGIADAEHQVEKELHRLWPAAQVRIGDISRAETGRIVEEFAVGYLLEGALEITASNPEEAPRAAFRQLRAMLAEGRYRRTEWEAVGIEKFEL